MTAGTSEHERPNKGMKLTSVEHIGRSQLIPGVVRTRPSRPWATGETTARSSHESRVDPQPKG